MKIGVCMVPFWRLANGRSHRIRAFCASALCTSTFCASGLRAGVLCETVFCAVVLRANVFLVCRWLWGV